MSFSNLNELNVNPYYQNINFPSHNFKNCPDISDDVMSFIFQNFLKAEDVGTATLVNRSWNKITKNQNLWKSLCQRDCYLSSDRITELQSYIGMFKGRWDYICQTLKKGVVFGDNIKTVITPPRYVQGYTSPIFLPGSKSIGIFYPNGEGLMIGKWVSDTNMNNSRGFFSPMQQLIQGQNITKKAVWNNELNKCITYKEIEEGNFNGVTVLKIEPEIQEEGRFLTQENI